MVNLGAVEGSGDLVVIYSKEVVVGCHPRVSRALWDCLLKSSSGWGGDLEYTDLELKIIKTTCTLGTPSKLTRGSDLIIGFFKIYYASYYLLKIGEEGS